MTYCSVCRREIIIVETKNHKHHHKYAHTYCRWRIGNFWRNELWSVIIFFIANFTCFLFLILAGAIGKDVVLRNVSYIVLAWTFISTFWLFWINYVKMFHECCDYDGKRHRMKKEKPFIKE